MAEKLISAEFTKRLAERLIKDEEECYNTSPKSWAEEIENFKHLIDSIPTIEAKPIVHAHWENNQCSNCKGFALSFDNEPYRKVILSNFCPHCGAQMDEEVSK